MGLLEIAKCLVILNESVKLHDLLALWLRLPDHLRLKVMEEHLGCCIELDTTPSTLLVSLEYHIGDYLELCYALKLKLLLELVVAKRRHCKVVALSVGAAEVNLFVLLTTSLDLCAHALNYDGVLRAWLCLRKYILTG